MEIADLKQQLTPYSRELCRALLPDGKAVGGNWRIGNVHGDPGDSMSVRLEDGTWTDFATGKGGDLLDLISQNQNMTLVQSMEWAQKQFNIKDRVATAIQSAKPAKKKTYATPRPPKQSNTGELHQFLEKRGFPQSSLGDICLRYKIYETEALGKGADVVFQFFDSKGQLSLLKNRPLNYETKSKMGMCKQSDQKQILLGWHTVPINARQVWLVEGEMDYIAGSEMGFPCLSLPAGAQNLTWVDIEWNNLDRFEEIVIAVDQDKPGNECAAKLLKRFGDRALRVEFPAKDINDLMIEHGLDVAKQILNDCYEAAKWQDPAQLQNVSNFVEDVIDFFTETEGNDAGFGSGFDKVDREDIRFRPNEVWGLQGYNGCGKSMFLGQISLNAMKQGKKVMIASMEMAPKRTLGRMCRQHTAQYRPPDDVVAKSLDILAPNLWLYVDSLLPDLDHLLSVCKYGYQRYGIDVVIIDSMTNLVLQDDYKEQQRCMEKLVNFKQNLDVTIFLVTHTRKGENEAKAPGKFDTKGSGAITDLADGFMSLWKNKAKQDHIRSCQLIGTEPDPDVVQKPDVILDVLKNRHGGFEGKSGFYFDPKTCQYLERENHVSQPYFKISKKEKPF